MLTFRKLKADEIDVRVQTVKNTGCSLLLYKDARCDMNILDETVGAGNWQRSHELINGNLFCNVAIKIEKGEEGNREFGEWVVKQDVGTQSNTEKEKGQASDSFKRACFNWGIGRELYTSPFIWINNQNCKISKRSDGKYEIKDKFKVKKIGYSDNKISELEIVNLTTNKIVFNLKGNIDKPQQNNNTQPITKDEMYEVLKEAVKEDLMKTEEVTESLRQFNKTRFVDLTYTQAKIIYDVAKKRLEARG